MSNLMRSIQLFFCFTDARLRRQPPPGQGAGKRQCDDQHRHVLLQDQERTPEAVKTIWEELIEADAALAFRRLPDQVYI